MKRFISLSFLFLFWGVVAQANLSVIPGFVSFGAVNVDGIAASQTVRVYNFGTESTSLSFWDTCSLDFNITHFSCFGSLGANQSCSVSVGFSPSNVGVQSCALYVNGGGSFQSVSISGSGIDDSRDSDEE